MEHASRLTLASLFVQLFCDMYSIGIGLNNGLKIGINLKMHWHMRDLEHFRDCRIGDYKHSVSAQGRT